MGDIGGGMWPKPFPNLPGTPFDHPQPSPGGIPLLPAVRLPWQYQQQAEPVTIFHKDQYPTKEQFEAFLELLRAAIKFDTITGQRECETAAKTAWIKSMCDHFGVESPLK